MMRGSRWLSVAALVLASVGPRLALAQSADAKVASEALFDEARKLMNEGKYAAACAKFEQSQRLDPGIGTLLYLADCYEKAGRIASAWATFREGASQARAAGQTERANAGESRAAALEGRLSRLKLDVAPENADKPGFVLKRGGVVVAKELWGVSVPVDGGDWSIEASAPGAKTWSQKIRVKDEGDTQSASVPALEADSAQAPVSAPEPVAAPPAVAPVPTPKPLPEDESKSGDEQRTFGLIVGGVGLVGLGVGTFFGLRAFSKNTDAKELCQGEVCSDRRGVTLTEEARDAAAISNVAFGIGAAALVGGTLLYFTAPSKRASSLRVTPAVGKSGAGLWLGGRLW